MAGDAQEGPEQFALDRVGRFFEDMAGVAQGVFSRNLKLWSTLSGNVRKPDYGADAMAKDAGRAMAAAVDNLDDIWTSLTRVPERQQVAASLPTAFLYFGAQEGAARGGGATRAADAAAATAGAKRVARGQEATHALADNAWVRVPPSDLANLPAQAEIDLSGAQRGVAALRKCLHAIKKPRGYLIETYGVVRLTPGSYTGFVYLIDPRPRPLANLRIVVEKP
jgi:hypothetical protein